MDLLKWVKYYIRVKHESKHMLNLVVPHLRYPDFIVAKMSKDYTTDMFDLWISISQDYLPVTYRMLLIIIDADDDLEPIMLGRGLSLRSSKS